MPFDPTLPIEGTEMDAAQMRAQFNGLRAEIPAEAVIDAITIGNPGDPGSATVDIADGVFHFTFTIPRGDPGAPGADGGPGPQGPPGPPVVTIVFDGITTLPAGSDATATTYLDGNNLHIAFAIPRGDPGLQGPPGEVTTAQMNDAIASATASTLAAASAASSANTNAVATLDAAFSDPPTLADLEAVRAKLNELILAARR